MLNFVKYFFNICWDGLLGFILHFVNLVNHWFTDVEPPLCLWNKSNLIMMYDPLPALLNFVSNIFFWGFLHLCSLGILACNFLVAVSSGFHIKVIAGFVKKKKQKQKNKTQTICGKVWELVLLFLLWMFGRIHQWGHLVSGFHWKVIDCWFNFFTSNQFRFSSIQHW